MTKCSNCDSEWSLGDVWTVGFSTTGKECPNCRKKQYISAKTKKWLTLGWVSLAFVIIFPFIIKLSNKDESIL
ncbi:hypothetical protein O0Q50_22880 [Priestia aryabhattai]|uniref:CXXC-20-CXXC protein n=1 Tax=Priestia aryabhattai TaxID=412384 RepID=A0AAX6NDQ1_PRIAR|nr:hypothetical protein [Priestia aryabhattai]MDU9694031.1 hypothetical protein [Priestia aryabhattai]NGY88663.1 hypothetical protein [Priestia megaterium]